MDVYLRVCEWEQHEHSCAVAAQALCWALIYTNVLIVFKHLNYLLSAVLCASSVLSHSGQRCCSHLTSEETGAQRAA